jgi:hypothetical protein
MAKSDPNKKNKEDKYGDDEMFESWTDVNIFFPIAKELVDPLYELGMTPNMVTLISTLFTLLSIYFLHIDNKQLAFFSYIFGYILDCVDGRMARKYNLSSNVGMALDCVSDNISNIILIIYILFTKPHNQKTVIFLIILILMSYMLSLSYGLTEAISAHNASQDQKQDQHQAYVSDDFYTRRVKQLKHTELTDTCYEKILYSVFLLMNKLHYNTYRNYFPIYDNEKINENLKILKHFGPGNYCTIMSIMLLYI